MNTENQGLPVLGGQDDHFEYVVDEEDIYEGDNVVREGRHGDWLSIILEGEADILRETTKGPLRIATLGPGAFVGSIKAVMTSKSSRSATLIAKTPVVLGTLDMARIYDNFAHMSLEMKNFATTLDKRLRQVSQRMVETHEGTTDPGPFTRDRKVMMGKGAPKTGMYVIAQGSAAVIKKQEKGIIPLALFEKGDMVGQAPFADFAHEPESAFLVVSNDCKMNQVDVKALEEEYKKLPKLVKGLFDHVAACIRATTVLVCDPARISAAPK